MSGTRYHQFCALARAAEIVGERWTLLIIRDLMIGPKRFGDLAARLDGVSPTMLTARLNALVAHGVIRKAVLAPPSGAQVYELTPLGLAFRPAMRELIRWGGAFLFPMRAGESFEPDWALLALDAIAQRKPVPARRIVLRLTHGEKAASFVISGGRGGTTIEGGEGPGEALVETGFPALLGIISGELPIDRAVADDAVRAEGSIEALRALPLLFDLAERRTARNEESCDGL